MYSKVEVSNIEVLQYRIICRVNVYNNKYSNLFVKQTLLKGFPTLKEHRCKNKQGQNFIDVMDSTSIPHLLEHLIIDYQVKFNKESEIDNKPIFGTTQWIDDSKSLAKIELSYLDDVIALKSIKLAQKSLNKILEKTN